MRHAVLLLSSGLDSAANIVLGKSAGFDVRVALTIHYGQRGARSEIERSSALAETFGLEHIVFDLSQFSKLVHAKSALFGSEEIPSPTSLDDLAVARKSAAAVWVPNRNGVMLSLAAALAESRGFGAVAVGFNAEEAVTFADNTEDFMRAMTKALEYSTSNKVQVVSATVHLNKTQIVEELSKSDFPFELLWSCYRNGESHCGECESCQRLKRALGSGLQSPLRENVIDRLFQKR